MIMQDCRLTIRLTAGTFRAANDIPPGEFRNATRADWSRAVDANMLTPIGFIRRVIDGTAARNFGRIANTMTNAS